MRVYVYDRMGRQYTTALKYDVLAELLEFEYAEGGVLLGVTTRRVLPAETFVVRIGDYLENVDVSGVEVVGAV